MGSLSRIITEGIRTGIITEGIVGTIAGGILLIGEDL